MTALRAFSNIVTTAAAVAVQPDFLGVIELIACVVSDRQTTSPLGLPAQFL